MRTNLPIISECLKEIDIENDILVHDRDTDGIFTIYTYKIIANIDFNSVIRNDITKIKITALTEKVISNPRSLLSTNIYNKDNTDIVFGDSKTVDGLIIKDGKKDSSQVLYWVY